MILKSYRDFNNYIINRPQYISIVYFHTNEEWCDNLNTLVNNLFKENCNGNISTFTMNIKYTHEELDLTSYPVFRLYKNGSMFQEIYGGYDNIETIIKNILG